MRRNWTEVALELDDAQFTLADLLAMATPSDLDVIAEQATRPLPDPDVPADEVRSAAVAFRRLRRLESGDDLKLWLSERGLTSDQWRNYLCRTLAPASAPAPWHRTELTEDDLWVALVCANWWADFAARASKLWAARQLDPIDNDEVDQPASPHEQWLCSLLGLDAERFQSMAMWASRGQRSLDATITRVATDDAIERIVEVHELEWSTFSLATIEFTAEQPAREAVMCSRLDFMTPETIAGLAGRAVAVNTRRYSDLSPTWSVLLSGALPVGSVIGPVAEKDSWSVGWLLARTDPDRHDPTLRALATQELVEATLYPATQGKVRALLPL